MFHSKVPGLLWLLASAAIADPPLTTIQDVLYKADGSKFAGTAMIVWSSFEASDRSNIVTQSTTVKIIDGALRVQLVPTTTASQAAQYAVKYNSDGKVQFQETWAVPPSSKPLRVRDVRVMAAADQSVSRTTQILESDVIGLPADLEARPTKGPGYSAGRAGRINGYGQLEAVTGNLPDCVRVDGSSGPCGDSGPVFVDAETPAGFVDGVNATYTLTGAPTPASSLTLFRNGILQKAGQDYTLTGKVVQFLSVAIPQPGDTLIANYRMPATAAAGVAMSAAPKAQ